MILSIDFISSSSVLVVVVGSLLKPPPIVVHLFVLQHATRARRRNMHSCALRRSKPNHFEMESPKRDQVSNHANHDRTNNTSL